MCNLAWRWFRGPFLLALVALSGSLGNVLAQEVLSQEPLKPGPSPRETAVEAKIRQALLEATSVEFKDTPLSEVCRYLGERHKIQIVFDNKALEDSAVQTDTPVTATLLQIRVKSVLNLVLKPLGLTYVIRDDVLMITSKDEADAKMETRVYAVRDLVAWGIEKEFPDGWKEVAENDAAASFFDFDSLIDTITSTVEATSWDDVGGPGSIRPLYASLVISQTQGNHEKIGDLLTDLRTVIVAQRAATPPAGVTKKLNPAQQADPNALVLRIYRLNDLAAPTGGGAGRPVVISPIPVVGNLSIQDDPLIGSTLRQVGPGSGGPNVPAQTFLQELTKTIPTLIDVETWQEAGGKGVIRALPPSSAGDAGTLLVRQTEAVHAKIQRLLRELQQSGISAGGGFSAAPAGRSGGGGFF